MTDILGKALFDFYKYTAKGKLWVHNQYGPREEMPLSTFFREEEDMPDLEWLALEQCRGEVLDIGAGAGCHALFLQQNNITVTALEISPLAIEVLNLRGVKNILEADIFTYQEKKYDTLLLLMNGIGLTGTIEGLKTLLQHFKKLLNAGGQILFDSSDISYLYENQDKPAERYFGELMYQYEYQKQKGDWFSWLYIDEHTMNDTANEAGFTMEVLIEDEFGQYVARLTLIE